MLRSLPFAALAMTLPAQRLVAPLTRPEASAYVTTSSAADVEAFVAALHELPHGDRVTVRTVGASPKGRPIRLVHVAAPPGAHPRLRALVIGNIHAGEVEGKEALQVLLREFANGEHDDLLAAVEPWFLPIYNVDGNEALGKANRPGQNGPPLCGERANGQGLDLNRDFVKAEAPETQALLALFAELDPHLFVDLHTTNGSYHGYQLTFAPALSPNVDPGVARWSRTLLDEAQASLRQQHGFATFDYGNFETRDWDGGNAPESPAGQRGWYTYDHRARYGINYYGLRNRLAILSEAYSYADFPTRIAATRAFVLELLHGLAAHETELLATMANADRALESGAATAFGFATRFAPPESLEVLVGQVNRVEQDGAPPRFVQMPGATPERMPVCRAFVATEHLDLPGAWAILDPSADVLDRLQRHGIAVQRLAAATKVTAARFAVTAKKKPKRPFQGHQELVLDGAWQPAAAIELPAGTAIVDRHQRLARVAATLLEPQSEDGLSNWNFFEATTGEFFPVLRLAARP